MRKRIVIFCCIAGSLVIARSAMVFVQRVQARESEIQCKRNMLAIYGALADYRKRNGMFPAAIGQGADGEHPHSWRVQLLPYLGHNQLYTRYRFDEPWDSPNNRLLAREIPSVYTSPFQSRSSIETGITPYLGITGPDSGWTYLKNATLAGLPDGAMNTIFIIEDPRSSVCWLSPEDASLGGQIEAIEAWMQKSGSSHESHFVTFAGECHQISTTTTSRIIAGMLTCNGGEDVSEFFLALRNN